MSKSNRTRSHPDLFGTLVHDETIYPHPGCRQCRHSVDRDSAGRFRIWVSYECSPARVACNGWSCLRCGFSGTRRIAWAEAMADALAHECEGRDWTDLLSLAEAVDRGSVVLR